MNDCESTPIYLAAYSDKDLSSGLKAKTDEEVNTKIESIIRLFCYLHGRDTFLVAY